MRQISSIKPVMTATQARNNWFALIEWVFHRRQPVIITRRSKPALIVKPFENRKQQKRLIEDLAGSVLLPKRFKGMSLEKIIVKAKKEYFSRKK